MNSTSFKVSGQSIESFAFRAFTTPYTFKRQSLAFALLEHNPPFICFAIEVISPALQHVSASAAVTKSEEMVTPWLSQAAWKWKKAFPRILTKSAWL